MASPPDATRSSSRLYSSVYFRWASTRSHVAMKSKAYWVSPTPRGSWKASHCCGNRSGSAERSAYRATWRTRARLAAGSSKARVTAATLRSHTNCPAPPLVNTPPFTPS